MNNQNINGHQVLHKFWYVIVLIFAVLTFCFWHLNGEFNQQIHEKNDTFELNFCIDTTNLKPQSLSFPGYSVITLDEDVWEGWQKAIKPIKRLNNQIFWLDNI